MPQNVAGTRELPPMSVPSPSGDPPAATIAACPPLLPPGRGPLPPQIHATLAQAVSPVVSAPSLFSAPPPLMEFPVSVRALQRWRDSLTLGQPDGRMCASRRFLLSQVSREASTTPRSRIGAGDRGALSQSSSPSSPMVPSASRSVMYLGFFSARAELRSSALVAHLVPLRSTECRRRRR